MPQRAPPLCVLAFSRLLLWIAQPYSPCHPVFQALADDAGGVDQASDDGLAPRFVPLLANLFLILLIVVQLHAQRHPVLAARTKLSNMLVKAVA